jgi:RHS repeat-associated protein
MLTSTPDVDHDIASFETADVSSEQNRFQRYDDARRINSILFDHTHNGATQYSQRLNGSANEKYGLARSLSVMPGDTVRMEVFAKYVDPTAQNTAALMLFLGQIASGTAAAGTVVDGSGYLTNGNTQFAFMGMNGTNASTGLGPKAYLNWLVFDRNFVLKTGGYKQVSTAAKETGSNGQHEKLENELIISEPGYAYVYLSNESGSPIEVYFDDFTVTHVKGPVVQESDYDPFGLTFNDYVKENSAPNDFLYNGKELQKDFDLNWYDYGARMYDAALGRWHVVDPMAEKYAAWSPYNYVMNDPIRNVDPDGRDIVLGTANTYVPGQTPVSVFMDQVKLIEAWNLLLQTEAGRKIIEQASNNHKIVVHIALDHVRKGDVDEDGHRKQGNTMKELPDVFFSTTARRITLDANGFNRLEVFQNLDVTDDLKAGKQPVFITVAEEESAYTAALTIGHEIEAHVNSGIAYGLSTLSQDFEHFQYGETYGTDLNVIYDSKGRAMPDANPYAREAHIRPGSPADKLYQQLLDNAKREVRHSYTVYDQKRERGEIRD